MVADTTAVSTTSAPKVEVQTVDGVTSSAGRKCEGLQMHDTYRAKDATDDAAAAGAAASAGRGDEDAAFDAAAADSATFCGPINVSRLMI